MSNKNSNVVLKMSFFDKNHESWNWYTNNSTSNHGNKVNASKASLKPISHIDYVGRKTACELEVTATPGSYAAYMNGDHNVKKIISEGTFIEKAYLPMRNEKKSKILISELSLTSR